MLECSILLICKNSKNILGVVCEWKHWVRAFQEAITASVEYLFWFWGENSPPPKRNLEGEMKCWGGNMFPPPQDNTQLFFTFTSIKGPKIFRAFGALLPISKYFFTYFRFLTKVLLYLSQILKSLIIPFCKFYKVLLYLLPKKKNVFFLLQKKKRIFPFAKKKVLFFLFAN